MLENEKKNTVAIFGALFAVPGRLMDRQMMDGRIGRWMDGWTMDGW